MKILQKEYCAISARRDLAHEQARKRLSRKIHDEVSQKLTVLNLELSLLAMNSQAGKKSKWDKKLKELASLVAELSKNVREITSELRPKVLDEFGLVAALQWYAKSLEKELCTQVISLNGDIPLSPELASGLFATCQEVVSEFFRSTGGSQLIIEVVPTRKQIALRLQGKEEKSEPGVPSQRAVAWLSIQERLWRLGGAAQLKRESKGQILITLSAPMAALGGKQPKTLKSSSIYGKSPDSR